MHLMPRSDIELKTKSFPFILIRASRGHHSVKHTSIFLKEAQSALWQVSSCLLPPFSVFSNVCINALRALIASLDPSLLSVSVCVRHSLHISGWISGCLDARLFTHELESFQERVPGQSMLTVCSGDVQTFCSKQLRHTVAGQTGVSQRPAWLYLSELWSHSATCISDDTAAMPVNVSQHHNMKAMTVSDKRFSRASLWYNNALLNWHVSL